VVIFQPAILNPRTNLKLAVRSDVGSCFSTTPCDAEIIYERNQYYPGEVAKVMVICDNSQCSAAVKSFKFKLLQFAEAQGSSSTRMDYLYTSEAAQYLITETQDANCAAGEKVTREFSLRIPTADSIAP